MEKIRSRLHDDETLREIIDDGCVGAKRAQSRLRNSREMTASYVLYTVGHCFRIWGVIYWGMENGASFHGRTCYQYAGQIISCPYTKRINSPVLNH
eukprot:scaffold4973_cov135-Cylindrotheca_fusiformis.AAC.6